MEGLAPPLKCLIEIQTALQNGEALRGGLKRYLQYASAKDDFASEAREFLFKWEKGRDWKAIIAKLKSPHRRALLEITALGLSGQPVLSHLEELKGEIATACDPEIKYHLEILPIKMLAPLLIFQFPAFLLLIFGPLLRQFVEELSR